MVRHNQQMILKAIEIEIERVKGKAEELECLCRGSGIEECPCYLQKIGYNQALRNLLKIIKQERDK